MSNSELTAEQQAKVEIYRAEWLKIGTSCEPMNREAARAGVLRGYELAGAAAPKFFVFLASPAAGAIAAALCEDATFMAKCKPATLVQRLERFSSVFVNELFEGNVLKDLKSNDADELRALFHPIMPKCRDMVYRAAYGQQDANWLGYHEFYAKEMGWPNTHEALIEVAKHAGWWWTFDQCAIITGRPTEIHLNDRGQLNNPKGPAIAYADGMALYVVNNVRVPKYVIMSPELITPEKIDAESNAEIRRVMVDNFAGGFLAYCEQSGAKLVHEDDFGKLWRKKVKDDEPIVFVELINSTPEPDGTFKKYICPVHHELRPMLKNGDLGHAQEMTAHNAVAASFGKYGHEYAPAVET